MITCCGLSKSFGKRTVVDGLDLEVRAGEIMALMGSNGAGKSTTIRMLLGLLKPDAGSASICGLDVSHPTQEFRQTVGFLPERVVLYPRFSARENVAYFTSLAGQDLSTELIDSFLLEAGLPSESLDALAGSLSKGMCQKVGLAMTVAKGARVLLLDEPLSGLDPSSADAIGNCFQRLAERGTTILMATHDLFQAHQIANDIAVLTSGKLRTILKPQSATVNELNDFLSLQKRTGVS